MQDAKKRDLYDKYGEDGLREGGAPGGGMGDIFDLFGMGGGRREGGASAGKKKVQPTAVKLEVSLEDLYNGKEAEVSVERHRICSKCNGLGGTDEKAVVTCKGCKGRG